VRREGELSVRRHRVALVTNGLRTGGAESQLLKLAQMLCDSGDEVGILSILPGVDYAEPRELGVVIATIGAHGIARGARAIAVGARVLHEWAPDTVISFVYQANILGRCAGRLARVPTIVSSIRSEHVGGRHREAMLRVTDRFASITTTNSQHAAERLVERRVVPRDRIVVVPNGIDIDRFVPDAARRECLRKELEVDDDVFFWLASGRLHESKDYNTLLRAFALLSPGQSVLAIAGDGPLRRDLEALAARLELRPRVRFLGRRDDVPALLDAADALVLSSAWEGSPNAVLEAMAASRPVVATSVGGVDELVDDQTGLLVPARQPAALALAMRELMARSPEHRADMGAAARKVVSRDHSLDAMQEGWRRVLSSCDAYGTRHPRAHARGRLHARTP
jgi:glycosyltransferase involved in cell wall biosynthesis